jgi:hypothetical protein
MKTKTQTPWRISEFLSNACKGEGIQPLLSEKWGDDQGDFMPNYKIVVRATLLS